MPACFGHLLSFLFVLFRNRAHLRPLGPDEVIPEIECEKQFMLVTGSCSCARVGYFSLLLGVFVAQLVRVFFTSLVSIGLHFG